jgi:FMN phosphatase YigB (HAD superfamily)
MRIGFDFDNTIVHYDNLFHKVALEQGVIDHMIPVNKLAVRDHLRATDREYIWTEMQGYVYGGRMQEADAYPEAIEVMRRLKAAGHTLAIMSHKTKHPYKGKQYDLHTAARNWILQFLVADGELLIKPENIFFELTKEEKLNRIGKFGCDVFIDDLPEILSAPLFPTQVKRYLFDPEQHHGGMDLKNIEIVTTWPAFENKVRI